jgi:hypothetical protein
MREFGPSVRLMSALGHKRTFAVQNGMSALLPKADMCSALGDVRFVPIADMSGICVSKKPRAFRPRVSRPHIKLIRRLACASCASQADPKRRRRWRREEVRRGVALPRQLR